MEDVGDHMPNLDGQIHVESMTVEDIYKEYLASMKDNKQDYLKKSAFYDIWETCFPYVCIR